MAEELISLDYRKWYTNEIELLDKALSPEQAWLVVTSVHRYAAYGTEPEVPQELSLFVKGMCLEVDNARKKYQKRCEVNRENGKKGGEAKARNAKNSERDPCDEPDGKDDLIQEKDDGIQEVKATKYITRDEFMEAAKAAKEIPYFDDIPGIFYGDCLDEMYKDLRKNGFKLFGSGPLSGSDVSKSIVTQYVYSMCLGQSRDFEWIFKSFGGCINNDGCKAGIVTRNYKRWKAPEELRGVPVPQDCYKPLRLLAALNASSIHFTSLNWEKAFGVSLKDWFGSLDKELQNALKTKYNWLPNLANR